MVIGDKYTTRTYNMNKYFDFVKLINVKTKDFQYRILQIKSSDIYFR